MEVEGQQRKVEQQHHDHMNRGLKLALLLLSCIFMAVGTVGGQLLLRLYFTQGGARKWFSSWLQTGGWPILFLPLSISYFRRRYYPTTSGSSRAKLFLMNRRVFTASVVIGLLTGVDDFLYAYGLAFLPVSTSAILISTQLVFTALFAFLIVQQRFTPYSINAVALLTVGAVMLGLHGSGDRPAGVSKAQYYVGFSMTLGAAVLFGLMMPLVELTYKKARQAITYTLVIEIQLVMALFATGLCTVGMLVNKDFQAIPREASQYGLGEVRYYVVVVWSAIFWQLCFVGLVGVIFTVNTLLAGIIVAILLPVTEVFSVIFFNEKFNSEKGVSLALSLWGLASYSYGEYRQAKATAATATATANGATATATEALTVEIA